MPPRLHMPSEDELPDGPVRAFVQELHWLWREARRPDLRTVATAVAEGPYAGAISREQFRRMLRGTAVPARWANVEAVFLVLCALAELDPDGERYPGDSGPFVSCREELLQRWHAAYDGYDASSARPASAARLSLKLEEPPSTDSARSVTVTDSPKRTQLMKTHVVEVAVFFDPTIARPVECGNALYQEFGFDNVDISYESRRSNVLLEASIPVVSENLGSATILVESACRRVISDSGFGVVGIATISVTSVKFGIKVMFNEDVLDIDADLISGSNSPVLFWTSDSLGTASPEIGDGWRLCYRKPNAISVEDCPIPGRRSETQEVMEIAYEELLARGVHT